MRITRRLAIAGAMAMALAAPAFADDKPIILVSVPGLTFPFFVHMMKAFKAEAAKHGLNTIESDGQVSSPKQTADIEAALTKGVKGIVLSARTRSTRWRRRCRRRSTPRSRSSPSTAACRR